MIGIREMKVLKGDSDLCEISGCKSRAAHIISLNRSGIRSRICICEDCLKSLYSAVGEALIPKSIETIRKTKKVMDGRV